MTLDARATYEELGAELAAASVTKGTMFGMPVLKIGKKSFASLSDDAMVFKLRGDEHRDALALAGAHPFDPMGNGRAMREWIVVPVAHAEQWPTFARAALAYVAELT